MTVFKIIGTVNDSDSYFCHYLANRLATSVGDVQIDFSVFFEVEFLLKLEELKRGPLGDINAFIDLAGNEYNLEDPQIANTILFHRSVREDTYQMMASSTRPIVYIQFMETASGSRNQPLTFDPIFIQLYTDYCPNACDNFIKLCTAGAPKHYRSSTIHRIVKNGWIQCGDVVDGSGRHSISASGNAIRDESFSLDFGLAVSGVVGYANSGPHSNGSQFFITLGPCDWMNQKFVGFGRVIQGFSALRLLSSLKTSNQVPDKNIFISACGIAPVEEN
eukprot:gene34295-44298_t